MEPTMSDDLIVHVNRLGIGCMLLIGIIGDLVCLVLTAFLIVLIVVHPEQRRGLAAALVVTLGLGAMCVWLTRSLLELFSPHTPMLVINHAGIRAGTKTFGSTEFVLSWAEIKAIYITGAAFCIRPISMKQVLSRFGPFKRIMLRITFPRDILVTQTYLEKPVSDIFEQLQEKFADELDHHHIQLHS